MKYLLFIFTLFIFSFPAEAGDYQTGSGDTVRVEVTVEVYTEESFFEITGRTLTDCQDPYNNDENCNLVIYEEPSDEEQ